MKQITDQQIAAVMEQAKHYAKASIEYEREYLKTKIIGYKDVSDMYSEQLNGMCVALEKLGIVDDSFEAFEQTFSEARRELYEDNKKH